MMQDCSEELREPDPQPIEHPGAAAAWFLLIAIVALAIFEMWALHTGHQTISHLFQRFSAHHWWAKFVGAIGLFLLWWHLFLRGPF
jgi:hypothetical protein